MGKGRCAECGREHDELEPAFYWPDAVFAVPQEERQERVRQSDDFVSVDDQAFFIRCVAPLPVQGRESSYDWGFWVKVARAQFEEYRRFFSVDPPADHPGFIGTLANQTRVLPPTLGLPVHVHLGRGRDRPRVMLLDEGHELTRQQERGVTEPEVHAWSELCQPHGPRLDPPAAMFRPTIEQDGWRVAAPGEVGRAPGRVAAAPAAGDLVKAAFAFLAADAHGQVSRRVELMWVLLDDVRADGWWSGTLADHPFVPGPIGLGTRVWLREEQALALRSGVS